MNWIAEIFSSTNEQARLVTTLIAASIAIVVVLVNQWFNSKRSRNLKTIEKLEEGYLSIIKLEEASSLVHSEIIDNYHKYGEDRANSPYQAFQENDTSDTELYVDKLNKEFYRVEATAYMLSGLYFPELKEDVRKYKDNYQELYSEFISCASLGEYIDKCKQCRPVMQDLLKTMYSNMSAIMHKHMH